MLLRKFEKRLFCQQNIRKRQRKRRFFSYCPEGISIVNWAQRARQIVYQHIARDGLPMYDVPESARPGLVISGSPHLRCLSPNITIVLL